MKSLNLPITAQSGLFDAFDFEVVSQSSLDGSDSKVSDGLDTHQKSDSKKRPRSPAAAAAPFPFPEESLRGLFKLPSNEAALRFWGWKEGKEIVGNAKEDVKVFRFKEIPDKRGLGYRPPDDKYEKTDEKTDEKMKNPDLSITAQSELFVPLGFEDVLQSSLDRSDSKVSDGLDPHQKSDSKKRRRSPALASAAAAPFPFPGESLREQFEFSRKGIGEAVLRRCGWKEGEGIGRNAEEKVKMLRLKRNPNYLFGEMESENNLKKWVHDKLRSLFRGSTPKFTDVVIEISKQASSPYDVVSKLEVFGLDSVKIRMLASEIFRRVPHKVPGKSFYQTQEREAAILARKQNTCALFNDENDDKDNDAGENVDRRSSVTDASETGQADTHKRLSGKKIDNQEDEDDEIIAGGTAERQVKGRTSGDGYDGSEGDRKTLPIYALRHRLLQAIKDHQVLVIVGEIGSGKTTQIPQYLHEDGYTKQGKVVCTHPRMDATMSAAAQVSQEMGVKLGNEVGYSIPFEDCTSETTVLNYMTDGMFLREFVNDPNLENYSVVMVDEAHERNLSTDILLGLLQEVIQVHNEIRLLIFSAALGAEKFRDFFHSEIFEIPGRQYPVGIYHERFQVADHLLATVFVVLRIHATQPAGGILVFLAGQGEVETVEEILKHKMAGLGTEIVGELIICPIYKDLPIELEAKKIEPTVEGPRRVVLATNIAETSSTIDGIKYVIDPGFCEVKSFDSDYGSDCLEITRISKVIANGRADLSRLTGPGKCYRLYTASDYQELDDNPKPEIMYGNLANLVLTLLSLQHDWEVFYYIDSMPFAPLTKTTDRLYVLGALDEDGQLTEVGRQMVKFPVDPMLSKMIVASDEYKCSNEIITIVAMLSVGNTIFYRPKGEEVQALNAWMNFHAGNVGDDIALLKVYNSWKETNYSTQWCYENYIQVRSMKRARNVRDQLEGLLKKVEIELTSNPNDLDAIGKSITSGFLLYAARWLRDDCYQMVKYPPIAGIHPSSGLAQVLPRWVVYHELVDKTKGYMRQVTEIKREWLEEVAGHYYNFRS